MELEDIEYSTLTNLINDYIKREYDYEYADVFDDEIDIHTYSGKVITISLNISIEEEENDRNREVNELEEYKIRNEKALDYIQKHKLDKELPRSYEYVLEDILKGGNTYDRN